MDLTYHDDTRQVQIKGKKIDLDSAATKYLCPHDHGLTVQWIAGLYRLYCPVCNSIVKRVRGKYRTGQQPPKDSSQSAAEDRKDLFGD